MFGISYGLRMLMDKVPDMIETYRVRKVDKASMDIISEVDIKDSGCNITEVFNTLETNNMSLEFKYKPCK
jgi:hypothetical protein